MAAGAQQLWDVLSPYRWPLLLLAGVGAVAALRRHGWQLARGLAFVWLHYVSWYAQRRRVREVKDLARQGVVVGVDFVHNVLMRSTIEAQVHFPLHPPPLCTCTVRVDN